MRNVLLIEDYLNVRLVLKLLLEKNNFRVIGEASDGVDGVEKYIHLRPDITIVDYSLPLLNGYMIARLIRSLDQNACIILCTGQAEHVKDVFYELGVFAVLPKPFTEEQLLNAIRACS
ncbi:response regulator [Paenibacillus alkaliterrae]|uniref:response regulator n=1 Tax=Paenibacillus alkaliterrae TaxID=320909 RepID=UPI001F320FD4|nr:response regulator [Paenibacillus alkaliterrae]MCF2939795.1 response regulator [Paenibacillus alkaliterrae]